MPINLSGFHGSKLAAPWIIVIGFTLLPGFVAAGEWSAGLNLGGGRNPIIGEDNYLAAMPVIAYRGERFHANLGNPGLSFFNGTTNFGGLGYSLVKQDNFKLDLVGRIRAMGIDPDDNDELEGLDERKPGFDVGIDLLWGSDLGELNGQLLTDVSNRSKGQELIVSYAYPLKQGDWSFRPEFGVSWQSSKLSDYYFGVDDDETGGGLESYEAKSTMTPFLGIQAEYAWSKRIRLIGGAGIGRLGDGISDSPIVDGRNLAGAFIGAVYGF
ncbi:MAG: MipA/OmpV family protein [Candidatus Thiodiazotropha lotti]|nr:MipA/OmpV family protein [Candidatus Thiodiazotropha lotti]MCG7998670.1 MipA/OmpV family protein [Candidatus Thiodiazotropha lotti]MCW4183823.1 MipA/OmpV family protein [Candidatus Thiodiazotropha weberae]MCW4190436.1 MipA/OmpV family protein [Candidatus Thiodiazotropha weberae]